MIDLEVARKFLQTWAAPVTMAGDGPHGLFLELTGILGGAPNHPKGAPRSKSVHIGDEDWLDQALEIAQRMAARNENVYFGAAPRTVPAEGKEKGRNTDEDVDRLVAFWADADADKDDKTGEPIDPNWRSKWRASYEHPSLPISIRVNSGHGYQLWWLLDQPLMNVEQGKSILERLTRIVPCGDSHVKNPSRIMRLPGFPHVKNPTAPRETGMDWCLDQARYSFTEIVRAFPEPKPAEKEKAKPARRAIRGGVQTAATMTGPRSLSEEERKRLVDLWQPGARHDLALAVAGAMRKAGWEEADALAEIDQLVALAGDDEDRASEVRTTYAGDDLDDLAGWKALRALGVGDHELRGLQVPIERKASDRGDDGRPEIWIRTDEHEVIDEAIAALEVDRDIYRRGNLLVHIVRDTRSVDIQHTYFPPGAPRLSLLTAPRLRELLAKNALWMKKIPRKDEDLVVRAHPPDWAVRGVAARSQWPNLRVLNAVVEVPVLRPDGTALVEPGYDEMTGLYFEPRRDPGEIPAEPTQDDAKRAADELWDLVSDFPFADPVHQSAWLAAMLTPLARYAIVGCVPMFLIDANKRGSGKGLLADIAAVISLGRELPRSPSPDDPEELRKKITAIAIEGARVVLIDNVEGAFGSSAFDAVITSTTWTDRVLGVSATTSAIPLSTMWIVTGNNVMLRGDLGRRTIHVRLDSGMERPESRADFRRPDILGWTKENQAALTRHALTILLAFCRAGRPMTKLSPLGSFESWSNLVRQSIVWLGLPDPVASMEGAQEAADVAADAQRQLLNHWGEIDPEGAGLTAGELLQKLEGGPQQGPLVHYPKVRAALMELVPTQNGRLPTPRQIGARLRMMRKSVFDGHYLDCKVSRGENKWGVYATSASAARLQQVVGVA